MSAPHPRADLVSAALGATQRPTADDGRRPPLYVGQSQVVANLASAIPGAIAAAVYRVRYWRRADELRLVVAYRVGSGRRVTWTDALVRVEDQ